MERVFITGMGFISSNGSSPAEFYNNCRLGKTGLKQTGHKDVPVAGIIAAESADYRDEPKRYRFCREALKEALDNFSFPNEEQCGLYLGCDTGCSDQLYWQTGKTLNPQLNGFPETRDDCRKMLENWSPAFLADYLRRLIKTPGRNRIYTLQCISSMQAVGEAFNALQHGRETVALCGGTESFHYLSAYTFVLLNIYSRKTAIEESCRPFDRLRSGIVIGEGAGFLRLESESQLKKSGAKPLCEILSYAVNNNAHHVTAQEADGKGYCNCISKCLKEGNSLPETIDLIIAHGTGTIQNDRSECAALTTLFPEQQPWLQSIKSYIGHTLAMSGIANIVAGVLQMQKQFVLPTLFLENPAEDCKFRHIPPGGCTTDLKRIIVNASAFGGFNSSLLLQKISPE